MSAGYEALATKAKAMYGKRIGRQDLERLAAMRSVDEVLAELRQLPGWSQAAEHLPQDALLTRATLESALREQIRQEYLSLLSFVPQKDRKIMEFPILRASMDEILAALRHLHASIYKEVEPLPPVFMSHSKVNVEALRRCTTFDGLVEATRGSVYHDALERLRSADGSLPDYGVTEALLGGVYYQQLQTIIRRKYDGDVRRILEKSVGSQVDMLNLMHILRMKRYFPQEDNYLPVLLPYHYKIKPQMIHAMCAAPSAEAVLELAQQTPYGRVFSLNSGEDLNHLYIATLYRTSRRQLMMGKPSIYSAVALMNLREIELKAVVSAVEAAKYQMALNPSILDMMDR